MRPTPSVKRARTKEPDDLEVAERMLRVHLTLASDRKDAGRTPRFRTRRPTAAPGACETGR